MTKIHDNQVEFRLPNVSNFNFQMMDYSVTSNQPWEGINGIWQNGDNWVINVRSGRSGSSNVANWFKDKVGSGKMIGCDTSSSQPRELNFAFRGTLSFQFKSRHYEYRNIVIGQGHNSRSRNNWWMGAPEVVTCSESNLLRVDALETTSPVKVMRALIFSPDGVSCFNVANQQAVQGSSWMKSISSNRKIQNISIPGTHDSGTEKIGDGVSHCQNFSIRRQLEEGIRFFDIRLNRQFGLCHGPIGCGINFDQVVNWCKDFLKNNSAEAILMSLKAEACNWDANMNTMLEKLVKENPNLFLTGKYLPDNLKGARGKIVLLKRDGECCYGIPFQFADNCTFAIGDKDTDPSVTKFYVEDCYSGFSTPEKCEVMRVNLEKSLKESTVKYCYVTFASLAYPFHTPYQNAWGGNGVDPAINSWLGRYISDRTGRKDFGIILLDFYNNHGEEPQLVTDIILSNFPDSNAE